MTALNSLCRQVYRMAWQRSSPVSGVNSALSCSSPRSLLEHCPCCPDPHLRSYNLPLDIPHQQQHRPARQLIRCPNSPTPARKQHRQGQCQCHQQLQPMLEQRVFPCSTTQRSEPILAWVLGEEGVSTVWGWKLTGWRLRLGMVVNGVEVMGEGAGAGPAECNLMPGSSS